MRIRIRLKPKNVVHYTLVPCELLPPAAHLAPAHEPALVGDWGAAQCLQRSKYLILQTRKSQCFLTKGLVINKKVWRLPYSKVCLMKEVKTATDRHKLLFDRKKRESQRTNQGRTPSSFVLFKSPFTSVSTNEGLNSQLGPHPFRSLWFSLFFSLPVCRR